MKKRGLLKKSKVIELSCNQLTDYSSDSENNLDSLGRVGRVSALRSSNIQPITSVAANCKITSNKRFSIEPKRGQISIEYLVVVGFVTFVILAVLGVSFFYSNQIQDTIRLNQLDRFSRKIISSAESTFYSGEPSKNTISVYLPKGIDSIEIIDDSIVIEITTSSGQSKMAFPSNVPIGPTGPILSTSSGVKKILLEAQSDRVKISEA